MIPGESSAAPQTACDNEFQQILKGDICNDLENIPTLQQR